MKILDTIGNFLQKSASPILGLNIPSLGVAQNQPITPVAPVTPVVPTTPTIPVTPTTSKSSPGSTPPTVISPQDQLANMQIQALKIQEAINNLPKGSTNVSSNLGTPTTDTYKNIYTNEDIQNLIKQNQDLVKNYLGSIGPSQEETNLQRQLAEQRYRTSSGLLAEENRLAPMELITGRTAALTKQAQNEENLLLTRLGIEQDKRKATQEGYKTAYEMTQDQLTTYQKIQDSIEKQDAAILAKANTLTDNARQVLSTVLNTYDGTDWEDLDENQRTELTKLAKDSGMDISLVKQSLKSQKDKYLLSQSQKNEMTATQQAKVNLANDVASMNSSMSKVAGSDGFIDPKDYLFAKKQWIAAGNDPKDFDDYFAVYRNPYDNYNTN